MMVSVTVTPSYPAGDGPPLRRRRRLPRSTALVLGLVVAAVLLVTGTGGLRGWWAGQVGRLTSRSTAADYVIGLAVGLLPFIGVALGALGARGGRRVRRMLWFGAIGFLVSYLLSPSLSRLATDRGAAHVFSRNAPGYLPGVYTGVALWLVALVVGFVQLRRRVRHHLGRL